MATPVGVEGIEGFWGYDNYTKVLTKNTQHNHSFFEQAIDHSEGVSLSL